MAPVVGNEIQFLFKFPECIFQKQVSMTPYIFYDNSMFVQKKEEIGTFYKQGSGLIHSLAQENPEKDNSEVSCSLGCAKYPPPLQSTAKPLAPLSCRSARSTGDPPGGEREAPRRWPSSLSLPASPGASQQASAGRSSDRSPPP